MDQSFSVENFTVKTDNHNIRVSQAFIYILEINRDLEDTTGVDLISAATAGVDSYGAVKIVQTLGMRGRAYVKANQGKYYLVLKGPGGQRPHLPGTRYLITNPKVAHIAVSPRSLSAGAARMTGIAILAYTSLRIVEFILSDQDARLTTLLGTIAADIIKFTLAASVGFLAGAAVGALTTIAAGPLIATIFVGVVASIAINRIDREFGLSKKIILALEAAVTKSRQPFEIIGKEVHQWERSYIQRNINNATRFR